MTSLAQTLATLSPSDREAALSTLTDAEAEALLHDWRFWARPEQLPPKGEWDIWAIIAGRGFGKTETGAQWIKHRVENEGAKSIALIAETQKDLEEVLVPRILKVSSPDNRPTVRTRPVRLRWPNGAEALGYNGTEPDQLRGPEFDTAWTDELAKYKKARETWDMLQFTMRSGRDPKVCVTTTPRPIELIKAIIAGEEGKAHVTRGKTADNAANLAPGFVEKLEQRYGGSRLGRQELNAEVLGDLPGALWSQSVIDAYRVIEAPEIGRVVVALDPAVTNTEDSDEHGIVVAGLSEQDGYVLEDASQQGTPHEWAQAAITLARKWDADGVVVEVNQGGDMVAHTLRSIAPNLNVIEVRATRGKHVRAEPISALYQQGRIKHVGSFPELEDQLTQMTTAGYQGEGSPDRADALVWAMTELFPEMTEELPDPTPRARGRRSGWMGA